jgi:hypothetical protein
MTKNMTNCRWFVQGLLGLTCLAGMRPAFAQEAKPAQPAASGAAATGTPAAGTPATGAPATGAPAAGGATSAASCESSYEKAQTDRLAGHYISASAAALACSQIQCNQAIVRECLRLYESLEQDTPTLVFSARKGEGGELVDVKVEMDGKQVADKITGRAMAVDPGPHQFAFIDPVRGRIETTETARVGDHARVIEAVFPDPNAKNAPPGEPGAADQGAKAQGSKGIPPMTYVLGGVAVVGLASFAFFRISGVGDYNHYNSTCSPECNPNDIDKVRTKFTLSYVSLGIGAAAAVGAGVVYVISKSGNEPRTEARFEPLEGGAMARLRTRF